MRGKICEREGENGYFCKKGVKLAILGSLRVGEGLWVQGLGRDFLCWSAVAKIPDLGRVFLWFPWFGVKRWDFWNFCNFGSWGGVSCIFLVYGGKSGGFARGAGGYGERES